LRQCSLSNSFDGTIQTEIDNWHDACDPYLPKDITTPTIADPTRTLDQDTCQTIAESCFQLSQATDACSSSHTVPADFTSCRCESSVISLASVCLVDGVVSCAGENVTTSDIWEFRECSAANTFTHATDVSLCLPYDVFINSDIEAYRSNDNDGRKHASGRRLCFFFGFRSIFNHVNNIFKWGCSQIQAWKSYMDLHHCSCTLSNFQVISENTGAGRSFLSAIYFEAAYIHV
jgi:hypothetical protein